MNGVCDTVLLFVVSSRKQEVELLNVKRGSSRTWRPTCGHHQPCSDPPSPRPFSAVFRFVLVLHWNRIRGSAAARGARGASRHADQSRAPRLERFSWEMAPSSKSEKDAGKPKAQKKHKEHVVKLLVRGRVGATAVLSAASTVTTAAAR